MKTNLKNKKLKLLFDATILVYWDKTGVVVSALNILKQFLKNPNVRVVLYCEPNKFAQLKSFLKRENVAKNYSFIFNKPSQIFAFCYSIITEKRKIAKENNKKVLKFLLSIPRELFRPIAKHLLYANYDKYDCYFSPMNRMPELIKRNKKIKKYTLLHDVIPLIFPDYHRNEDPKYRYSFINFANSLNSDDYYFANSDYTKNDFLKYCKKIDKEKITTTLLACDENFKPQTEEKTADAKRKYDIPQDKKYIFSLCTIEPRKNLSMAVKSFIKFIEKNNIDDLVFVLSGSSWWEFLQQFKGEINNFTKLKDKIIQTGYVAEEDLPALYSGSEWFVYTSTYEGFGLPPLEAMSCGVPVVTSNSTSLPEVVGNCAITIDCESENQHIEAYEKFYFDKTIRKKYSEKGLERAKQFSWKKCADKMLEVMFKNQNLQTKLPQEKENNKKKILVLRCGTIGDSISVIPFFKELRRINGKNVQIETVSDDKNEVIYENCPYIDNLVEIYDPYCTREIKIKNILKYITFLKLKKYDKIYFISTNKNLSTAAFLTKIKERTGYCNLCKLETNYFLNKRIPYNENQHVIKTYLDLLEIKNPSSEIFKPENPFENIIANYIPAIKNKYIAVHPFSRVVEKDWKTEKWRALAAYIAENLKLDVVILGSADDFKKAQAICTSEKIHNYCGKILFRQVVSIINGSELFIGIDSGLIHVAAALKKKSVLLQGATSPAHWRPINENCKIISKNFPCSPCKFLMTKNDKCKCKIPKCMEAIEVKDVIEGIEKIR